MPPSRYSVKSVEISGFRGYRDPKTLDLDARACLLFGANRSGKTSTLGAIEWCLFGKFGSLKGETSRTLDEVVNDHSPSASTVLELQGPDGTIKISRTKQLGKRPKLEIIDTNGNVHKGNEAQGRLYRLLGLGYDDFTRAVYLHQEDIRDLIVGDRDTRSEAMDRLLGLDQLRNISEGLDPSPIRKKTNSIDDSRGKIISKIRGLLQEAQKNLEEDIQRAASQGLTKSNLSLKFGSSINESVFNDLTDIASEVELEVQKPGAPKDQGDLVAAANVARSTIKKIRGLLPETKNIEELTERQTKLTGLKSELSGAQSQYNLAERNVASFVKEHGDETTIRKNIEKTEEKIKALESKLEEFGAKQNVIKYGLGYLSEFVDVKKCPICAKAINRDNVLEHLRKEAEKVISKQFEKIDRDVKDEKSEFQSLKKNLEELSDLNDKRNKALQQRDEKIVEIATVVGRTLETAEDATTALKTEIDKVKKVMEKSREPLKKREQKFSDIESRIDQLLAIADVLRKKQRVDQLFGLQKSDRLGKVNETLEKLGSLQFTVGMVADAVRELQTELAPREVERAMPAIKEIYGSLVGHPFYSDLFIDIEPSTKGRLKNIYNIKAMNPDTKAETLVSQRFSTGDMNCAVLSVFLGMAKQDTFSHGLDFLIIDDPSQNLDPERKVKLSKMLADIAGERQVLIASQDTDLQHLLREMISSDKAKTLAFGKWDTTGVEVRVT